MEKKKLNVKRIKQMCSVPGCSSRGSYTMARTRYFGGVNICEDCLREALALIEQVEPTKPLTLEELLLDGGFKEQFKKAIEDGVKEELERVNNENDVPDDTSDPSAENTVVNENDTDTTQNEAEPEHTGGAENPSDQTNPEEKSFVCGKCGKVCASQSGLTKHEKACVDK